MVDVFSRLFVQAKSNLTIAPLNTGGEIKGRITWEKVKDFWKQCYRNISKRVKCLSFYRKYNISYHFEQKDKHYMFDSPASFWLRNAFNRV